MATNFPTSLDNFTNPTSGDPLNSPSHSGQHADANDAIEALEIKVGINNSANTASLDYLTRQADAIASSGLASGTYYTAASNGNTLQSTTLTLNAVSYIPFLVEKTQTFDRIACRTAGQVTGSGTMRLGIYNNSNKRPSTVVLDAGTVAFLAATTVYAITIDQTLTPGWYWLAAVMQSSGGSTSFTTIGDVVPFNVMSLNATFNAFQSTWSQTGVTGAFDTAASLTATTTSRTLVALRTV
jgi:hypothetical protein